MKKVLISIFTLILIISMVTYVSAATTGTISLSSSKETIKAGDEFSVTVTATDSNGYNGITFDDVTVLDSTGKTSTAITLKSVDAIGENSKSLGSGDEAGTTAFTYNSTEKNTSAVEVCKLTFEVTNSVVAGTYTINVNNMKVYSLLETDDETVVGTKNITVKAIVDDTTADTSTKDNTTNNTNTQKPNKNSSSTSSNKSSKSSTSSSTKKTTLPQTGVEMISVIAMAALTVFGIVSYTSYKKYKNI